VVEIILIKLRNSALAVERLYSCFEDGGRIPKELQLLTK